MRLIFFLCFCFLNICSLAAESGVTYELTGGRLGDTLIAYLHSKWLSHQTGVKHLYRPFPYSKNLVMDQKEELLNMSSFDNIVGIDQNCLFPKELGKTLFICPYFPEVEFEYRFTNYLHFPVDWKNEGFRKNVREMISPNYECELLLPPRDEISVALHIRDGGNYDSLAFHHFAPIKMSPISFYVQCIREVLKICDKKNIYCRVFSDSIRLEELMGKIMSEIPSEAPITFDYRKENNADHVNVLEDFFSLFHYDILIRPASNFSIVPSLIHDYALVLYPGSAVVDEMGPRIDQIIIDKNEELLEACLAK